MDVAYIEMARGEKSGAKAGLPAQENKSRSRFNIVLPKLREPVVLMVLTPTHFKSVACADFSVIPIQLKVLILRNSLVRRHGRIASFILRSKTGIFINYLFWVLFG